jgi:hypothetical protein
VERMERRLLQRGYVLGRMRHHRTARQAPART